MVKKLPEIAKTVCFLLVFLVLFYFVSATLKFKYDDGVRPMENYYALPEDTVDVLMLGSSHIGMNVDPYILWQKRGIASYVCWAGMQPTWNTYYYLRECLKTQRPKVVVMDTYLAANDLEYSDYETMVKTLAGMRFSKDKLEAIRVSASPEYQADVMLGFPTYHYRYSDLSESDFQYYFWQKDPSLQTVPSSDGLVEPISILDTSTVTGSAELAGKCGDYFMRIIDCCEEQGIPLVFVTAPYDLTEIEQQRYNTIAEIAAERGIPFLNFNEFYADLGIDPQTDFRDPGHMNDSGIAKYSTYLADYLHNHYELPDRREDPSHIWNQAADSATHCVYSMEEQFVGGGLNYRDTGVKLFENPYASFTLLTKIDTRADGEDMVYLSCFSEEEGHYRGLLIRKEADGRIDLIYNTASRMSIRQYGDELTIAVVKNGLNYQLYVDGEPAGELTLQSLDSYDGTLLLGCEMGADGKRMRYSDVRVNNLEIYDTALDAPAIRSWEPETLPQPAAHQAPEAGSNADYELAARFEGNAVDGYVDTGISLYDAEDRSWTILTQFREGDDRGSGVYLSCFAEELGNYRGLLVRRGDPGFLEIIYGNASQNVAVGIGADVKFAVVKDRYAYSVYVNGEKLADGDLSSADAYPGHLLIGAQETMQGEKMRFSGVTVYNLEYYSGVMSDAAILNWNPAYKAPAEKPAASPVAYRLDHPFLGDGAAQFIDTGVRLYDVADKDWTLTMKFRKDRDSLGMLASCFAEVPGSYRGLLINLVDTSTLSLTLGQTAQTYALPPEPEQTLQIVKRGYAYTVYLNGELAGEPVESIAPAYDGTLHIGCQTREDGTPFRFSGAKILEFNVE